jgi:hypothetical protein
VGHRKKKSVGFGRGEREMGGRKILGFVSEPGERDSNALFRRHAMFCMWQGYVARVYIILY